MTATFDRRERWWTSPLPPFLTVIVTGALSPWSPPTPCPHTTYNTTPPLVSHTSYRWAGTTPRGCLPRSLYVITYHCVIVILPTIRLTTVELVACN